MHSDHYKGLVTNWNNGTIYCSKISKILMLNIFPGAQDVVTLELNTTTVINLDQKFIYINK